METKNGDLLKLFADGEFDVIVHGCNCHCTMGSGIARSIREQYPIAYETDCLTKKSDPEKLGTISVAQIESDTNPLPSQYIVNAYTQFNYLPRVKQCDYDALRKCFKRVKEIFSGKRIGYPLIGCGLAGGDWDVVSSIIDEELGGEDHTLVIYTK